MNGLVREAMMGHDGPMPAPDVIDLPPLTCRDFTSWQLTGARFVMAHISNPDGRWEVLQTAPGFQKRRSVHLTRQAAEEAAEDLAKELRGRKGTAA